MAFEIQRRGFRPIQTTKRNIPLEQILAVRGQNPLATGIETAGNVLGQAIARKAELQRQGQQLAKYEQLGGLPPGSLSGLDVSQGASFAAAGMKQNVDIQEEARKLNQNTLKIRGLEKQFGYEEGELGDDHPSALLKVQSDIATKRIESGPAADRAKSIEKGRYRNYLLDMEQRDPVIKEMNKQGLSLAAVDSLTNLVNDGNTVAFSALGLKMAKGMGEVGVMTEQDVKRYVTSGMLTQKAADTLSIWLRGRPTQATLDDVAQITAAMKTAFQERAQPRYDQYINSYAGIEGITPEEFASKLSLSYGKRGVLKEIERKKPSAITPATIDGYIIKVKK